MSDTITRPRQAPSACERLGWQSALLVLLLAGPLTSCGGAGSGGGGDPSSTWTQWQRIVATELPSAWQVEEASVAFDAWEASAVVTHLSALEEATVIRFDDDAGHALEVRLAALPSARYAPTLAAGDTVHFSLIRREGFGGVAQGLTVFDRAGRLLLLYDDGGYGTAFFGDEGRAGLSVERSSLGSRASDEWATLDVTFRLDGDSVVLAEGRSARLGETGLVVTAVVSRQWTGPPITDVDLSPLAYLAFRADGR